jgi:hypothetical protein
LTCPLFPVPDADTPTHFLQPTTHFECNEAQAK